MPYYKKNILKIELFNLKIDLINTILSTLFKILNFLKNNLFLYLNHFKNKFIQKSNTKMFLLIPFSNFMTKISLLTILLKLFTLSMVMNLNFGMILNFINLKIKSKPLIMKQKTNDKKFIIKVNFFLNFYYIIQ